MHILLLDIILALHYYNNNRFHERIIQYVRKMGFYSIRFFVKIFISTFRFLALKERRNEGILTVFLLISHFLCWTRYKIISGGVSRCDVKLVSGEQRVVLEDCLNVYVIIFSLDHYQNRKNGWKDNINLGSFPNVQYFIWKIIKAKI